MMAGSWAEVSEDLREFRDLVNDPPIQEQLMAHMTTWHAPNDAMDVSSRSTRKMACPPASSADTGAFGRVGRAVCVAPICSIHASGGPGGA